MDMKNALSEALMRRKKSAKSAYLEEPDEKDNKKYDLAPEVRDASPSKVEVEIGLKPFGMPPEMGDATEEKMEHEPDDMKGFIEPEEEAQLNDPNFKPKSLLQRAQMMMKKK